MSDLYLLGDRDCLRMKRIAVVGTRRVSPYGARVTEQFVLELVKRGWCIVSGLALGVDAIAHRVAIANGGKTIAVLAHGLDYCYPPQHVGLKQQIVESGGLLVSTHPNGVKPTPDLFRARNSLIVQLSEAVLVTALPHKSGAKITIRYAGEQGKDVYVIPGPIDDWSCQGASEVIMNGGIPVASPDDLIQCLL